MKMPIFSQGKYQPYHISMMTSHDTLGQHITRDYQWMILCGESEGLKSNDLKSRCRQHSPFVNNNYLRDFIEDKNTVLPVDSAMMSNLKEMTTQSLIYLTPKEERVLRLRFGIGIEEHTRGYTLNTPSRRNAISGPYCRHNPCGCTLRKIAEIPSSVSLIYPDANHGAKYTKFKSK